MTCEQLVLYLEERDFGPSVLDVVRAERIDGKMFSQITTQEKFCELFPAASCYQLLRFNSHNPVKWPPYDLPPPPPPPAPSPFPAPPPLNAAVFFFFNNKASVLSFDQARAVEPAGRAKPAVRKKGTGVQKDRRGSPAENGPWPARLILPPGVLENVTGLINVCSLVWAFSSTNNSQTCFFFFFFFFFSAGGEKR